MRSLPPERQRAIRALSEVPWFVRQVNQVLAARSELVEVVREGYLAQHDYLRLILEAVKSQAAALQEVADLLRQQID
jgi:hypothetical protein